MIKNANEEVKSFFEDISREDFKEMLQEAGFKTFDGEGKIIFEKEKNLD